MNWNFVTDKALSARIHSFMAENNLEVHGGASVAIRTLIALGLDRSQDPKAFNKQAFKEGFRAGYSAYSKLVATAWQQLEPGE